MTIIPYDDPAVIFRVYPADHCDEDGYPFLWPKISRWLRISAAYRCGDCGAEYLRGSDALDVHHINMWKADCRRANLEPLCRACHMVNHCPDHLLKPRYCRRCRQWFLDWAHLHRHIRGVHGAPLQA
jgi:hypothetical protein